jgi:predicted NAD/FAD-binding protein
MEREKLQKLVVIGTFIAGIAAAYLMHRRGEPLLGIAKRAITNPVGSLATEVQNAWSETDDAGGSSVSPATT